MPSPNITRKVSFCCFSDIRSGILLFGTIQLVLQMAQIYLNGYLFAQDYIEVYLAIGAYSIFNIVATFYFIIATGKDQKNKTTCTWCYIIGLLLNLIIIISYWSGIPSIHKDYYTFSRSIVFHSSVVVVLIYHVCGFIFIRSISEERIGCQHIEHDLESGNPLSVEIPPPSMGFPGFQQQYTNVPIATAPSIH